MWAGGYCFWARHVWVCSSVCGSVSRTGLIYIELNKKYGYFGRRVRPTWYAPPASNDTGTALGQDGSDWSRELATLTFDLGGHGACSWWGSSSSIRIPSLKFVALPFERYGARCVWALMGLVTLIFDILILKLVCESHQRRGIFLPNLGTLGLWILELFAIYATNGRTDRRTDGRTKATLIAPSLRAGHNKNQSVQISKASMPTVPLTACFLFLLYSFFFKFIISIFLFSRAQTDISSAINRLNCNDYKF